MLDFNAITIDHQNILESYFKNNQSIAAVYNFNCLLLWQGYYNTYYALVDDTLVIRMREKESEYIYILPPTPKNNIKEIMDQLFYNDQITLLAVSPAVEEELSIIYSDIEFISNRNSQEYIYSVEDLIQLKGKSYHGKKNHINKFLKLYPNYKYEKITESILPATVETLDEWCEVKGCKDNSTLKYENRGIKRLLDNIDRLNFKGAVLKVGDEIIAITIGSELNDEMAVIHFEKANPAYHGSYTMINNLFLTNEWCHKKYVNREEDMGIAGLRKAKMSYKPAMMNEYKKAIIKR